MPINDGGVIIVEDDVYSVEVLGQFLELLGVKYHVIDHGDGILEAMYSFSRVDAIFVDLELSDQNGYNVLKVIRSDNRWNLVPVVAYTSHTHQKSQAREAGFHSFLGKPLNSNLFPNQLRLILSNEPVWD